MTFLIRDVPIERVAVLAPMAGMTDVAFRRLCMEQRCGLVYTELVHAELLLKGVRRSLQTAETMPTDRPVGVQLYGPDPDTLAEAARYVEEHIPCDLIDLNMGCPVAKVVSKGAGAAIMRQPKLVERLTRAVVDAVDLPVTAKTRSGWTDREINAVDVGRAVEAGGGQALAVHARTRAQRHEGPVNWTLLADIKRVLSIPVIGNGGIDSPAHALRMRAQTGVDAVMVGRGALGNPWIFGQIDDAWHDRPIVIPSEAERRALILRHVTCTHDGFRRWARKDKDVRAAEGRAMAFLRGHLVHYVKGAPGAREFKHRLNFLFSAEEVMAGLEEAWQWDEAVLAESGQLAARDEARSGPRRTA